MKKIVTGGVAVAAVVAIKIAIKAGVIAALFGGGVVANNAYQSRVDEVKQEVIRFNKDNKDQKAYVDETNRRYIIATTIKEIPTKEDVDPSKLASALSDGKRESISYINSHGDEYTNKFLINQGWTEVDRYVAADGSTIGETYITAQDLN